ncbi:MAG: hypothetical protein AAF297_06690 [Planctomycetota bacterium]
MTLEASQLDVGEKFKRFNTEHLVSAWQEAHYASQAAAELGKSWGEAQDDDSHSSFAWFRNEDGRGLEGVPSVDKGYVCRLKFEGLELSVHYAKSSGGRTVADLSLAGRTFADAMEWVGETCEREIGPRRQASKPAPDLPMHALASGATFADDPEGFNDLADVYGATALIIDKLRESDPRFDEPRCWPHHFDLATLAGVGGEDAASKTIGFGLTPPDSVDDAGYWYVSPWAKDGVSGSPEYPPLADGYWLDRGDGIKMAVLPVSAVSGENDRSQRLAGFVAGAINACLGALDV